jgi:hypothetical protein
MNKGSCISKDVSLFKKTAEHDRSCYKPCRWFNNDAMQQSSKAAYATQNDYSHEDTTYIPRGYIRKWMGIKFLKVVSAIDRLP